MEICADCGKPIEMVGGSYYRKLVGDDIGKVFHSTCGDPFGIKAAIAAERERCAKIAEMCPVTVTDAAFEYGSAQIKQAREDIAAAIRTNQ